MALSAHPRPSRVYYFFFIVMPYSAKIFPLVVYFFYNLPTKFLRFFETQICVGYKKTKTKHGLPLPYLL